MKPITYQIEGEIHGAFVGKDGQSVCCGKCHSVIGKLSRLVLDEDTSNERRLPQADAEYDPVLAQARARILGGIKRAGIYLTLKTGYRQIKDGLFAFNSQSDKRSHEGRVLGLREEGMVKKADEIWPEGKSIFVGTVRYRFHEIESDELPPYKTTWLSENYVVFDIFGNEEQIAKTYEMLGEQWNRERQEDLRNKFQAELLRENAQHIAQRRSEKLFLQPPPVPVDQGEIPVQCWFCKKDNVVIFKRLSASFENWESGVLAKNTRV